MIVADILKSKGDQVVTIAETAPIATAIGIMSASMIGALVVEDAAGRFAGLLVERDVIVAAARWAGMVGSRPVRDAMRARPLTVAPTDPVSQVMARMTENRARHAPVLKDGRLVGIISIGDILKSRLEEKTQQALVLQEMARWPRAA